MKKGKLDPPPNSPYKITIGLPTLQTGDRVALVAPAGPVEASRFFRGVRALRKTGLKAAFRRAILRRDRYLAGSDRRRTEELIGALADRGVKAVIAARGGYGTQRILPRLRGRRFPPKILVGSSDLTILMNWLWKQQRLPSLYGPMVATHLHVPQNAKRLAQALTEADYLPGQTIRALARLRPGQARGRLAGGCLTLVVSSIGTPYEIDTRGSILLLEDTNEEPYAVDRMLTQLIQAGKLRGVRGIVLGTFCLKRQMFPVAVRRVFEERLRGFRGPVLWGIPFGHHARPLILPIGSPARIRGTRLLIEKGPFE